MILLKNVQKIHKICRPEVKAQLEMMLTAAGYKGWDVGVSLSGDRTVKKLNNEYRGKNRSTDILSFRFAEAIKPGKLPKPQSEDDKNLGDLFISMKYVEKWCQEHNVAIEDRLPVLYAHGICHLLGYDHQNDKDYALMKRKEKSILKKVEEWQSALESKS
ncbi:MAG: Endoribonuclease YbeY [Linnemannia elongata]|nr:MAG: Endoribonuclease YbeY [Linnemannia elongata]